MTSPSSNDAVTPVQADPIYHHGFYDAQDGEPLFSDAHPTYAAGWRAYWIARDALADVSPESRTFYRASEELTPEGVQLVIPGCEKQAPVTAKQGELW